MFEKKIHDTKAALGTFKLLQKQNYTCLGTFIDCRSCQINIL